MPACYHSVVEPAAEVVWYVAYGSNLSRERFLRYLDRPPRDDRALTIGHALWFGGESTVWGGGRAYLDHESEPGRTTLARAWLLDAPQWDHLHLRENGPDGDRYPVLLDLGEHEGVPVRSFTGPDRLDLTACTRPRPGLPPHDRHRARRGPRPRPGRGRRLPARLSRTGGVLDRGRPAQRPHLLCSVTSPP